MRRMIQHSTEALPDGQQIENRQGPENAQVFDARAAAVPLVRTPPRRVPQVRRVPNLLPQDG